MIALHPYSARAQAGQAHLRILETTDIHVNLLPYDYYADRPNDTMGLSRTASIIEAIRAEAANSMLLDNGDFLQGSPMGDYIAYERGMKAGDVHPVIKGMNMLGYDASTLGNHEFNYGLDFMAKVLAGANFPFVCANLVNGTRSPPIRATTRSSSSPTSSSTSCSTTATATSTRSRSASSASCRRRSWSGTAKHLDRQGRDPRHRRGGAGLGPGDQGSRRRHRHRPLPLRHRCEPAPT